MMLLSSLNLLFDAGRGEDSCARNAGNGQPGFPTGQLTSTAWEGWWHDDAA